jgi:hypothetical protein
MLKGLMACVLLSAVWAPGVRAATCRGEYPCRACTTCEHCKHCAREGGHCSVNDPQGKYGIHAGVASHISDRKGRRR